MINDIQPRQPSRYQLHKKGSDGRNKNSPLCSAFHRRLYHVFAGVDVTCGSTYSKKCHITSERTDSLYWCIARPSKNRLNKHVPNNQMKRRKNNGTHIEQSPCQKTGETAEKRVVTENCMRIRCGNGRWAFCIKKKDTSRNVQANGAAKTRTTSPTRLCSTVIIGGQIAENKHV